MCGLAALICYGNNVIEPKMICAMTDIIKHRGPDDEGFLLITKDQKTVLFGGVCTPLNVYHSSLKYTPNQESEKELKNIQPSNISILLGHRRLSILDLSPMGHQPMCLLDQSLWITYNGEIYNFLEIRNELEMEGHVFISKCDTEVILAAYKHWGKACLDKFNGMFAFVIIDLKKQCFFAARDRFGVKPLYFWHSPKGFLAFASEIKQFTVLPGWEAKINTSRAMDYLAFGVTDFSQQTLFKQVLQLRGGEFIECPLSQADQCRPVKWYQLKKNNCQISFEEAVLKFHDIFEDAVRLRLRADVNVGSCLSGGLDSSAITCMMHRLLQGTKINKQQSFSARSHISQYDEGHYIEEVTRQTGVQAHFVTPSLEDLFNTLKKVVWHQDEPFGSSSIYAQYLVFDLAKKAQVKVVLDGQGADESLGGYNEFWHAYLAQLIKTRKLKEYYDENKLLKNNFIFKPSSKGIMKQLLPNPIKDSLKKMCLTTPLAKIFFPWINLQHFSYEQCIQDEEIDFTNRVDRLAFDQIHYTNLPSLLRYEDRNSMAHSIESRTPFLDYRLVEFIFSLPMSYKISKGYTKRVLREAMTVMPEKIRWRTDKLGFATAEEVWMCNENPNLFREEIVNAISKSGGLINEQAIQLADDMFLKRIPFDWTLWRIINFGYWAEAYI